MSITIFALIMASMGVRAWRDLSNPDSWSYFHDRHSPSLTSVVSDNVLLDGSRRRVLAVSGEIGAAAAPWLRDRLDEAKLQNGDVVVLSSPGGDLDQSLLMGEELRRRGLYSAVGKIDRLGNLTSSDCASGCVFVYAGGTRRYGIAGSRLGVHRFVSEGASDPIAQAQRTTGRILGYVTRMGIDSSIVEAMSKTRAINWLDAKEAMAMNLITAPVVPVSRSSGISD